MSVSEEDLARSIEVLASTKIKLLIFDMDQTAVNMHSRGQLKRTELEVYINEATQAFRALVPALVERKFKVAIATHSDEAEFARDGIDKATHILGEELATSMLCSLFPQSIVDSIFIVAYNPKWHADGSKEENIIKRYHMRALKQHFRVSAHEMLFFDDTSSVVNDCLEACGVQSVLVDSTCGFQLSDLLRSFQ